MKFGSGKAADKWGANVIRSQGVSSRARIRGHWNLKQFRNGLLIAERDWTNIVVNEGLDHLLDVTLVGGTQDTSWFLGLVDGASPTFDPNDTLASHPGWTENTAYAGNRKSWVGGAVSGQSTSNSATPAQFTINADSQVLGGAFLCAVDSGSAGILYAEGNFTPVVNANTNDVVQVTGTFTMADDGV